MTAHRVLTGMLICALLAATSAIASSWPRRMGNLQNTGDAGPQAGLTPETAVDLELAGIVPTQSQVNATPIVSDGLLFIGDWQGWLYVIDLETFEWRIALDTGARTVEGTLGRYQGVQSTGTMATVTVPDGEGATREERRFYFAASHLPGNFWCLDVERILADRTSLEADPGTNYLCAGADWPISLIAPRGAKATFHGAPLFSRDQPIEVGREDQVELRDVLYVPSPGLDCDDGVLWAIDAYSGDRLWMWDPVVNGDGQGGVIWTVPAMSRERNYLYVTTGDCVQKPQAGELAESIVALDPASGRVRWWHQRRIIDTADMDIGNAPVVTDVEGEDGCRVVVNTDKDGCVYGYRQEVDIPDVGAPGFDPLRLGQQRLLWRTCLVPGSLGGGFNASAASVHGRYVMARSNQITSVMGDNANAFALDACTGTLLQASADVGRSPSEGSIASGMFFITSGNRLQVVRAEPPFDLLASVALSRATTSGGGGPAIAEGTVYVPLSGGGVAIVGISPDSGASTPVPGPAVQYRGPYPVPIAPVLPELVIDPDDPYGFLLDE